MERNTGNSAGGALSHVRVLDLSRVLAGPWAGQLLADLGADVIKVERPGKGDDTRQWGPPYLKDRAGNDTSEAAYFLSANRGKRSVTIDITKKEGQALVRDLVKESDVLMENYKTGGLGRYGLDYDSLKTVNPGLVYCSITGFGQTGPLSSRPGYDVMVQAMSGLMSITGDEKGEPQKVGVAVSDLFTGLYATVAVLAALIHRDQTGQGQYIDLALLDVQLACLANQAMNYLTSGLSPQRLGNAHPNIVPYQSFPTADGYMIIAVGNDEQFARLCTLLGCPELSRDRRFMTNKARVENRDALIPVLEERFKTGETEDWLNRLEEAAIPCGPINTIGQAFENEQIKHRGMKMKSPHPRTDSLFMVANPIKFSGSPVSYLHPPPWLGQHTGEVLDETRIKSRNSGTTG